MLFIFGQSLRYKEALVALHNLATLKTITFTNLCLPFAFSSKPFPISSYLSIPFIHNMQATVIHFFYTVNVLLSAVNKEYISAYMRTSVPLAEVQVLTVPALTKR